MTIELGHFAITLALVLSVVLGVAPMIGAARGDQRLIGIARPAALGLFVLNALGFACLMNAFIEHDFSVRLVASHSNTELPTLLRVAATWGSHEGSILLWTFMLSGWTAAVALFSRSLSDVLRARILAVMGLISIGFLAFLLFTSNPFERLLPPAAQGRDLNPLLQDPGMIFHPPLLYMGYVGLSVAFAFAVAGLIGGHFDLAWARWARPWTTVAWSFLTVGIALGSFWAYYELGWGGWWFWDPVENASFMPWLVATALIHSLAVTEKRGAFKSWTVLLAIVGFSLSLLGTFLVRSGVLTSVHAFATDPTRGVYILAFLAVVIGGSLTLFALRANQIGLGSSFNAASRESMLLANNILFVVATAAVLLGTLYPLVLDVLDMGKISVGPPYFNSVFYPLMAPALFLMAVGPLARWKQTELPALVVRLRWALAIAVIIALLGPAVTYWLGADLSTKAGPWRPMVSLGLAFAVWIAACVFISLIDAMRGADGVFRPAQALKRARLHPASVWGMHLAHLGVAVFVLGVTCVNSWQVDSEVALGRGEVVRVGQYALRFESIAPGQGPNYETQRGTFSAFRGSDVGSEGGSLTVAAGARPIAVLHPEKRTYRASGMPMTEAAIHRSPLRDLYLSMGEPLPNDRWVVRAHVKPLVNWIWSGCLLMALGGLLAVADKRYRRTSRATRRDTARATDPVHGSI